MKDVHELFTARGIKYWLDAGSLLGALRHEGIIPWDTDLDIGMLENDIGQVLDLEPELNKLGYSILRLSWGYKIRAPHTDLDIFLFRKKEYGYIYMYRKIRKVFGKRDNGPIYYTEDELYPLKEYTFGELTVMGPNNPFTFVDLYFKDWRTTAKFLKSHNKQTYYSTEVILTDELKVPARPTGPLEDRIANLLD